MSEYANYMETCIKWSDLTLPGVVRDFDFKS